MIVLLWWFLGVAVCMCLVVLFVYREDTWMKLLPKRRHR